MGKKRSIPAATKEFHKQSLSEQIEDPESYGVRTKPRAPKKSRSGGDEGDDDDAVRPEQSSLILSLAREQQEEEQREVAAQAMGGTDVGAHRPGRPVRARRARGRVRRLAAPPARSSEALSTHSATLTGCGAQGGS